MGAKLKNITFQQNTRSWAEDDLNAYFHERSTIIMLSAFSRKIHQQEVRTNQTRLLYLSYNFLDEKYSIMDAKL